MPLALTDAELAAITGAADAAATRRAGSTVAGWRCCGEGATAIRAP